MDNDEIMKRNSGKHLWCCTNKIGGAWDKCVEDMLNEARADGYKEGQKAERQRCIEILNKEVLGWIELAAAEREKPTGIMHDHLEWYEGRIHYTREIIAKLSEKVD
jgi:hypothetical protein